MRVRWAHLRTELDGIYIHLHGLSREYFDYILDTFNGVRTKDIDRYGEYRTKRLVLAAYDRYVGQIKSHRHGAAAAVGAGAQRFEVPSALPKRFALESQSEGLCILKLDPRNRRCSDVAILSPVVSAGGI